MYYEQELWYSVSINDGVRQGFEFIQGSLTVYTCVKCPMVGQKFCVNAPSKAPLRPEGGGGGIH